MKNRTITEQLFTTEGLLSDQHADFMSWSGRMLSRLGSSCGAPLNGESHFKMTSGPNY